MNPPGPIEPTATQTISGLYVETFRPAGTPKGVVLITHGYAEHCGRYRELAHVIVQAGWAALSYDVRGHGKSPGERGYIDRFASYLDDLVAMHGAARALVDQTAPPAGVASASGRPAGSAPPAAPAGVASASAAPAGSAHAAGDRAPLVLLGHSHGSLITLRALAEGRPLPAAAAILSSPFLALHFTPPLHQRVLAKIGSVLAPKLSQANGLRVEDLTADKQKQAERLADQLCFDVATARWFTEALAAQDYVLAHAARIALPTTWLVGGADKITNPARSQLVASKIAGAKYHDLAGMQHEVFNEVDRGKVFTEVVATLAQHERPSAAPRE